VDGPLFHFTYPTEIRVRLTALSYVRPPDGAFFAPPWVLLHHRENLWRPPTIQMKFPIHSIWGVSCFRQDPVFPPRPAKKPGSQKFQRVLFPSRVFPPPPLAALLCDFFFSITKNLFRVLFPVFFPPSNFAHLADSAGLCRRPYFAVFESCRAHPFFHSDPFFFIRLSRLPSPRHSFPTALPSLPSPSASSSITQRLVYYVVPTSYSLHLIVLRALPTLFGCLPCQLAGSPLKTFPDHASFTSFGRFSFFFAPPPQ